LFVGFVIIQNTIVIIPVKTLFGNRPYPILVAVPISFTIDSRNGIGKKNINRSARDWLSPTVLAAKEGP
jgi:hypothetical protein